MDQYQSYGALREYNKDPMSSFLFCLILRPVLDIIENRLKELDPRAQVLAILDVIEINIGVQWTKFAFDVATDLLNSINIHTVP